MLFVFYYLLLILGYAFLAPDNWQANPTAVTHLELALGLGIIQWAGFMVWGGVLKKRQQQHPAYIPCLLYLFSLPFFALGLELGFYSLLSGVILLGSTLAGAILFGFARVIGPFILNVSALVSFAVLIGLGAYEHTPIIQAGVLSTSLTGTLLSFSLVAAAPFIAGSLFVTYLLLSGYELRTQRLRHLARTDPLTGRFNRRATLQKAKKRLHHCQLAQSPFSISIMDLDHFKRINDTWGHASGDIVLRALAQHLPSLLAPQDILGRIGGEEFVIVMPNKAPEQARELIDHIRSDINLRPIALNDQTHIHVTASFGLYTRERVDPDQSLYELLKQADQALYKAKNKGRDRIEVAA